MRLTLKKMPSIREFYGIYSETLQITVLCKVYRNAHDSVVRIVSIPTFEVVIVQRAFLDTLSSIFNTVLSLPRVSSSDCVHQPRRLVLAVMDYSLTLDSVLEDSGSVRHEIVAVIDEKVFAVSTPVSYVVVQPALLDDYPGDMP